MPIIKIYSPNPCPNKNLLHSLCKCVTSILKLPHNHVWAFWHQLEESDFHRSDWNADDSTNPPMVMIYCKNSYSQRQIEALIDGVSEQISVGCNCDKNNIYISCFRVQSGHLMVRGELWIDS
ncbi:hypothetical protein [Bacillus toyonensis]|uniref:hypothetical protein n=1 Tax=Bacillus toyonensis TaxID=155322 RepID=UPI000BFB8468|nr:hypothetical protein [Bacillus toyonensis]PHE35902.1 hypothetical protein COF73_01465 [Bacillus toyonensis]